MTCGFWTVIIVRIFFIGLTKKKNPMLSIHIKSEFFKNCLQSKIKSIHIS